MFLNTNCNLEVPCGLTENLLSLPPEILPVRLADFPRRCSGRVEILYNNTWGTVSDNNWDLIDAHVVCQQMGCGRAVTIQRSSIFGRGSGQIWLHNVQCSGNEPSLNNCGHDGLQSHNCSDCQDAGVICEGNYIHTHQNKFCSNITLQLRNNCY